MPTAQRAGPRVDRPVTGFVATFGVPRGLLSGDAPSGGAPSGSGVLDGVGLGGGSVGVGVGVVGSGVGVGVLGGGVDDSLGRGVGVGVEVGVGVGVGMIVIGGAVGPIGGRPSGWSVDQIDAVAPPWTVVVPTVEPRKPEDPPSVTLVDTPDGSVSSVSSSAGPPATKVITVTAKSPHPATPSACRMFAAPPRTGFRAPCRAAPAAMATSLDPGNGGPQRRVCTFSGSCGARVCRRTE